MSEIEDPAIYNSEMDLSVIKKASSIPPYLSYDYPKCIRQRSNWGNMVGNFLFDSNDGYSTTRSFHMEKEDVKHIQTHSQKAYKLLNHIKEIDKRDMKEHGIKFKHFIFTDLKSSTYGAKLLTTLLRNYLGMHLGFHAQENKVKSKNRFREMYVVDDNDLLKHKGENVFMLSSTVVFGKPISVALKKKMLEKFNSRPDNIYGDLARIIVLDSGFKEGIDLFDVRYVHLFEPAVTNADQTQAIGRATRTCGQKGLRFNNVHGWPLYVYIYDTTINDPLKKYFKGSDTLMDLYLKTLNIDTRLMTFASELEDKCITYAVDADLTADLRKFEPISSQVVSNKSPGRIGRTTPKRITVSPFIQSDEVGCKPGSERNPKTRRCRKKCIPSKERVDNKSCMLKCNPETHYRSRVTRRCRKRRIDDGDGYGNGNGNNGLDVFKDMLQVHDFSEMNPVNYENVSKFIKKHFDTSEYKWKPIQMINMCGYDGKPSAPYYGGSSSSLVNYTPTQAFIRDYFAPRNPVKGMLLWHSVGTGKTCTAIASATYQFEREGYSILWVTRTTLKSDIWKNMFNQVCSYSIRRYLDSGKKIPDDQSERMKMLSKSWFIKPISYKQFSNIVNKSNEFYKRLSKLNGQDDPLRKTLIILDEAHKLYGESDLSTIERPDMNALHKAIMHSYVHSGEQSVRILLMTATPITISPMELIQLLNLIKMPNQQFPSSFDLFANMYLDDDGKFTSSGKTQFADDVAGLISYLNRSGDPRQFAQPVIKHINIDLVPKSIEDEVIAMDKKGITLDTTQELKEVTNAIEEVKENMSNAKYALNKNVYNKLLHDCDKYGSAKQIKACKNITKKIIRNKLKEVKSNISAKIKEPLLELKDKLKLAKNIKKEKFLQLTKVSGDYKDDAKQLQYLSIRDKCGTINRVSKDYHKELDKHPAMISLYQQIDAAKEAVKMNKESMNATRQLANMKREKVSRKTMESFSKAIRESNSQIKRLETQKKSLTRQLGKSMKTAIKNREKSKRKLTQKIKSGEYVDQLEEGLQKQIYEEIKDELDDKINIEVSKIAEKESLKAEKAAEKERKKAEKEALKAEKAAEKDRKRAEKAAEKERKKAEKTRKRRRT
jgi:hypothetical protein